jgi:hypothetical protein
MVLMQVERETNPGPFVIVVGLVLLPVVPVVWWYGGWRYGLSVWFGTLIVAGIIDWLVLAWRIPSEARAASRLAVAEFKRLYPSNSVVSVAVRAVEPDRFVFSVRYQEAQTISMPPQRRYFAVTRTAQPIVMELDTHDWPVFGVK